MLPSHKLPSRSLRRPSPAVGKPGLCSRIGNSVALLVLGSRRPSYCTPKLEYQTAPLPSTVTSCGEIVARGKSYSVYMTRVAAALGRDSVLSSKFHCACEL